jgi:two-component system, chemotaxis family, response regulator WspF
VRIAIVNDMMMAVEAVRRVIASSTGHQLAWVALDGEEAVTRAANDTPDLILMDLIMPRVDGVEATRRIMATHPCAIVVVTASINENSSKVFEAMGAGALDAVNTPVLEGLSSGDGTQPLLSKIETIRKLIGAPFGPKTQGVVESPTSASVEQAEGLVAIGASAGGPAALGKVLSQLGADFPAPVVIVQHVDVQFAKGLADWLQYHTPLKVRLAEEGDRPVPGTVLLAGTDNHLVFTGSRRLGYVRDPSDCSYRPSVDVFFKSIEANWDGPLVATLLTGMGRDGAEGLRLLKDKGYHTIAQDRTSSAVYGMPKAAAELNAATEILPVDKIGGRVAQLLATKVKAHA